MLHDYGLPKRGTQRGTQKSTGEQVLQRRYHLVCRRSKLYKPASVWVDSVEKRGSPGHIGSFEAHQGRFDSIRRPEPP